MIMLTAWELGFIDRVRQSLTEGPQDAFETCRRANPAEETADNEDFLSGYEAACRLLNGEAGYQNPAPQRMPSLVEQAMSSARTGRR